MKTRDIALYSLALSIVLGCLVLTEILEGRL